MFSFPGELLQQDATAPARFPAGEKHFSPAGRCLVLPGGAHCLTPPEDPRPQAGSVTVQSLWRLKVSLADTSSSTLAPLTMTET